MDIIRECELLNWPFSRQAWALQRHRMEGKPLGRKPTSSQGRAVPAKRALGQVMRHRMLRSLRRRGYLNAFSPKLTKIRLSVKGLPIGLAGFTILHMTDLHMDSIPELGNRIHDVTRGLRPDICVMTGDYITFYNRSDYRSILPGMEKIVNGIKPKHGAFAVLGNHDTWRLVPPFEDMGIRMLINESVTLGEGSATFMITGVDDPHEYLTEQAISSLKTRIVGFKLALVHTPELFREAAENQYNLYLAGHTHGGQICLPGGIPVFVHLNRGHRFFRGKWRFGEMTGYTGQGVGTVGVPLRFNTHSEITLITLVPENELQTP